MGRGRAQIVGVGETRYARWGKIGDATEHALACEAIVKRIAIRLGAPAVPGKPLRFSGRVAGKSEAGGECVLELAVRAANDLGDHATGTVVVTLPGGV